MGQTAPKIKVLNMNLHRLRVRPLVLLLATAELASFGGPSAEPKNPTSTLQELRGALSNHISSAKFARGLWGIKVVSLETGNTLFEHNSHKLFVPASNTKLYTVALALDRLGPDYRIRTSLYAKAKPDEQGTVEDDLLVYGRGDPSIAARLHGDIYTALQPLVSALKDAGVKRIKGDLVGDESYFRGPLFGSGWMWDDLEYGYGAEISALTINDNTVEVCVKPATVVGQPCTLTIFPFTTYVTLSNTTTTVSPDAKRRIHFQRPLGLNLVYVSGQIPLGQADYCESLPFHEPAGLFVWFLREALGRAGIAVEGKLRVVNWMGRQNSPKIHDQMVELGAVESLPVSRLAKEVLKPSQNLYADLLLACVGEKVRSDKVAPELTSEQLGIRELGNFLGQAGVERDEVAFEEGSGLSRDNLASPNATVALLQFMNKHACREVYLDSLPIAGVDGTLRERMRGTAAAGNLRAKTGTLHWANSLSGYVTSAGGERLVFSLMLNRFQADSLGQSAREELDAIGVMLAEFKGHS